MKILQVISSGGMYGAEAVILNLSRTLNESSHSSVLGVFANSTNLNLQLHERALGDGIESNVIPCSGQIDRAAMARLRELAVRTKVDIVHTHGFKADIYAYFGMKTSGIPLVSTCHTWYDHDPIVSFYGRVDRFILRRYAAVVAVSEAVKQRLLGAGVREDKIRIIKNGIDLRPFGKVVPSTGEWTNGEGPTIGLVGRLSMEKGIDIFLHAASRILKEIPNARFIVVGEGPEREKLESLIDQLGIRRSARLVGRRDNMSTVYATFDLMVSSSHHEGLPMAILEGMASRLPCVATAVGDVPKIIQDGLCGVLVRPGDVDSIAAKLISLIRDPAERRRLGDAARRRIKDEFSAERMTADYLNLYQQVLTESNPRVSQGNNDSASQGKI